MEEKGNPTTNKMSLEWFLESRYFLVLVIVLVAAIAFILGRISKIEKAREPVRILSSEQQANAFISNSSSSIPSVDRAVQNQPVGSGQSVVASKSGSKYHYSWCPGAKQISEKNKITFNSIEDARAKGYTPASNCKGLK